MLRVSRLYDWQQLRLTLFENYPRGVVRDSIKPMKSFMVTDYIFAVFF